MYARLNTILRHSPSGLLPLRFQDFSVELEDSFRGERWYGPDLWSRMVRDSAVSLDSTCLRHIKPTDYWHVTPVWSASGLQLVVREDQYAATLDRMLTEPRRLGRVLGDAVLIHVYSAGFWHARARRIVYLPVVRLQHLTPLEVLYWECSREKLEG